MLKDEIEIYIQKIYKKKTIKRIKIKLNKKKKDEGWNCNKKTNLKNHLKQKKNKKNRN